MAFVEKTISIENIFEGAAFKVVKHKVEAVNGQIADRDIVLHNGAAVMIAITDDNRILVEYQYRKALDRIMLELPAGKTDPGEDPLDTAKRELKEETGYTAGDIKHLVTFNPSCGYSTELVHIYICRDLVPGENHLDDTEDLDVDSFTADELYDMIMSGKIIDSKTIIGILFARCAGEI